jgi:hypothetical protein
MVRTITTRLLVAVAILLMTACSNDEIKAQTTTSEMKLNITIDGKTLPVILVENEATRALVAALQESPITYEADDYGGFEKVGALGRSLPTSNQQITTEAGDVILYSGNQIVLFYGSNTWSYTRLGRIQYTTLDELKSFLKAGQGRISVTLSAEATSSLKPTTATRHNEKVYAMNGTLLQKEPTNCIFIKNGRKYIK